MATKNQVLAQISNLAQATARNSVSPTDLALVFSTMLDACYSELDDSDAIADTDNRLDALANVGNRGAAIAFSDAEVKPQAASLSSTPALVVYLRKSDCVAGLSGGEYYLNWPGREAFSQSSGKPYSNGLYRIDGKLYIYLSGSMVSVTSLLTEASNAAPGLMPSADKFALDSLMRNIVVIEGVCESTTSNNAQAATVGSIWWVAGDNTSPRLMRRTETGWEVPTDITDAEGNVPMLKIYLMYGCLWNARKFADGIFLDQFYSIEDTYFYVRDWLFHESPDITAEADADMIYTLSLTDSAKRHLFNDEWNVLSGCYGKYDPVNAPDPEHLYYLNEIWMTYEEAMEVKSYGRRTLGPNIYSCKYDRYIRTNLPPIVFNGDILSLSHCFTYQKYLEVAFISDPLNSLSHETNVNVSAMSGTFYGCTNLKRIVGNLRVTKNEAFNETFTRCDNLEEVHLILTQAIRGVVLKYSKNLSLDSVLYMVQNKEGDNTCTITVHPEVYAKLTDPDNAEWFAVLEQAINKNISFATV